MNSDGKKEIELSKCNVQIAANVFQRSIIEGIEECLSNPVTVVNEKLKNTAVRYTGCGICTLIYIRGNFFTFA